MYVKGFQCFSGKTYLDTGFNVLQVLLDEIGKVDCVVWTRGVVLLVRCDNNLKGGRKGGKQENAASHGRTGKGQKEQQDVERFGGLPPPPSRAEWDRSVVSGSCPKDETGKVRDDCELSLLTVPPTVDEGGAVLPEEVGDSLSQSFFGLSPLGALNLKVIKG